MSYYRILLSCESDAWCQALTTTFEENSKFHIIDNVAADLLSQTAIRLQPDILVWKVNLRDHQALLGKIKKQCPYTLFTLLIEDPNSIDIAELVKSGVRACLPLRLFPHQIVEAVELTVEAGIMCLPRPNSNYSGNKSDREYLTIIRLLSSRERQVLELILEQHSNQEIAADLCLAESTVKTHLHNIYHKIGVHNRNQAYAKLFEIWKTKHCF